MIRLYPEQLAAQLREGLRACYLLCGNDPLLLQESQDHIRQAAQSADFVEHFTFTLDTHTDWDAIFSSCQALSLFASRQTLLLVLPDNGPSAPIAEQLLKLIGLLHDDILLIIRGAKLSKAQENGAWFKALSDRTTFVSCQTPEQAQLPRWVAKRATSLSLQLDDAANQLLCYCYEGNLLALSQALERLALLYPDGKLTLPRVEQAVNDAAHFTPYHWLDALLAGKSKRALHILTQLQQEDNEPVILLRTVQRELLMLLTLKRKMDNVALRTLFDQQRVWQNRRTIVTQALQRLSLSQLHQAVKLLTQMEIRLKQDYGQSVWPELEMLSMLLCGKPVPAAFIDEGSRL
ncbi:DNA polymerase III subunit delta [Rouxiella sp. Mn2063]|uniref:DNA polymerase III subunit delta n=1 Tax=Rouxiella sp. Mn2063 TaxID=3395262 RepID=UPI003BD0AF37